MSPSIKLSGEWTLSDDSSVFGELLIDKDRHRISLTLTIPHTEGRLRDVMPHTGNIPYIFGTLRPLSAKILLLECVAGKRHTNFGKYTQQLYSVRYAFIGLETKDNSDPCIKVAEVNYGDIGAWADLSQFDFASQEDGAFGYVYRAKPEVTLRISDALTISLVPIFSSSEGAPHSRELTLRQEINVIFKYRNPTTWSIIEKDIECFAALLSFSMGEDVVKETIRCLQPDTENSTADDSNFASRQMIDVYLGTRETNRGGERLSWQFAATLEELAEVDAISCWYNQYDLLSPIIDLYLIGIRGNAPSAETLFLNLTQALETLHSRFVEARAGNYMEHVREVIHEFGVPPEQEHKWEEYLLKDINRKKKSISLHNRIAYLIVDRGNRPFHSTLGNIVPYTEKLVATRNYYTHYSESRKKGSFSKEELPYVNSELMALIEYHILLIIGIPREAARIVFGKRLNSVNIAATLSGFHSATNTPS